MIKSTGHWTWSDLTFERWRSAVDERLKGIYALSIDDAGLDDEYLRSHWEDQTAPYDFVEWFAIKYDLDPLVSFGLPSGR